MTARAEKSTRRGRTGPSGVIAPGAPGRGEYTTGQVFFIPGLAIVLPTREQTRLLSLKAEMSALGTQRVTYSADYAIIETVDSVYRSDCSTFYTGRQFSG